MYGELNQVLECQYDRICDDFMDAVKDTFNIHSSIVLQRYDNGWHEWINMRMGERLILRQKIRCISVSIIY
jgi:hypothetical protein